MQVPQIAKVCHDVEEVSRASCSRDMMRMVAGDPDQWSVGVGVRPSERLGTVVCGLTPGDTMFVKSFGNMCESGCTARKDIKRCSTVAVRRQIAAPPACCLQGLIYGGAVKPRT